MSTPISVPQPGQDSDGDYDPAEDLWDEANAGSWTPEAWHQSPQAMVARAQAQNQAGAAHVAAHAGKHNQPPAPPSWVRPF